MNRSYTLLEVWLPVALFAVLWGTLIRQLSYIWGTNEQYAYGWFVPLLALGLLRGRWMIRPQPSAPNSVPTGLKVFAIIAAFSLLPLRIIHEINQDWSFLSFLLASAVVALSLYSVYLIGGRPWVRNFAFPICFILVAVNWPYRIENSLKHRLMGAVAGLTVEIISWFNVPAVQHGNVIELSAGSVGVEDACSGIRSLQSTIMAAFFLGELYLLKWRRRFFLLAAGIPLAFCLNIVRTLFLTWQASRAGNDAVAKWHDSAGVTISLVCIGCLWIIALFLAKWHPAPVTLDPSSQVNGPAVVSQGLAASCPSIPSPPSGGSHPLPLFFSCSLAAWVIVVLIANEAWYRAHETDPAQTVHWSAQFPTNSPGAHKMWIDQEIKQVLKFDQGDGLSWDEPDGTKWSAFYFRWRSGEATSRMSARDHRPEICLPSRGYQNTADLGIHFLPAHGLELPFRAYTFEEGGHILYVFFCLWEDGAEKQTGLGRSKYLDRLDSVLEGKRRMGQQTLEIVVSGYGSMTEAEQALRQRLASLIQLGAATDTVEGKTSEHAL